MKKILILGKTGQIGWELCRTLAPLGHIEAFDREALDLADPDKMTALVRSYQPQIIVNAAAYTNVEKAEEDAELPFKINEEGPRTLAEEAKKLDALLIHYSTDYVFDGMLRRPYCEEDKPHPLNRYGTSKLAGEKAIETVGGRYLILRTSWVFGIRGKNFLKTMLSLQAEELKIVNDQIGAPTWSRLIAEATALILAKGSELQGTFHLTAQGETTWYEFAKEIFKYSGIQKKITPISTQEYGSKVRRPSYSVLSNKKLEQAFGILLPDWKEGLSLCLN